MKDEIDPRCEQVCHPEQGACCGGNPPPSPLKLKHGDLVMVRPLRYPNEAPRLAKFNSYRCDDASNCESGCCEYFSYFGSESYGYVNEIEVVRRVHMVDEPDLESIVVALEYVLSLYDDSEGLREDYARWEQLHARFAPIVLEGVNAASS